MSTNPQVDTQSIQNTINDDLENAPIKLSTKIIIDADKIKSIPGTSIAEILEYVFG